MLKILQPNCKIVEINKLTEGAACTTLLAKKYINNNDSLIMQIQINILNGIVLSQFIIL